MGAVKLRLAWLAVPMSLAVLGVVAACSAPETHPPVLGDCKDPAKCNPGGDGGVIVQPDAASDGGTNKDAASDAAKPDAAADGAAADGAAADAADDGAADDGAADAAPSDAGADGNG